MVESTFTIEFPEHLPRDKWQYVLDQLMDTGASIEQGEHNFIVVCNKPSQTEAVGWALFHTHFNGKCKVVATSGSAVAQASAYSNPLKMRNPK